MLRNIKSTDCFPAIMHLVSEFVYCLEISLELSFPHSTSRQAGTFPVVTTEFKQFMPQALTLLGNLMNKK